MLNQTLLSVTHLEKSPQHTLSAHYPWNQQSKSHIIGVDLHNNLPHLVQI